MDFVLLVSVLHLPILVRATLILLRLPFLVRAPTPNLLLLPFLVRATLSLLWLVRATLSLLPILVRATPSLLRLPFLVTIRAIPTRRAVHHFPPNSLAFSRAIIVHSYIRTRTRVRFPPNSRHQQAPPSRQGLQKKKSFVMRVFFWHCCRFVGLQRRLLRCRHYVCMGWLVILVLIVTVYSFSSKGAWSPPITEHETGKAEELQIWQQRIVIRSNLHHQDIMLSSKTTEQLPEGQRLPSKSEQLPPPTSSIQTTLHNSSTSNVASYSARPTPVLDTHGIKIIPKSPVLVAEDHALQITCVAIQLMHRQEQFAPYMTFELPTMSLVQERKLSMALRPGDEGLTYKAHLENCL